MLTLYEFFRHTHLEWAIYTLILSVGLMRLFLSEGGGRRTFLFVPGSTLAAALVMPLVDLIPFTPVFASQGTVIWAFYLLFLVNFAVFIGLCFPNRLKAGLGYVLYYLLFIVLVKGALVPLYSSENAIDHVLYAVLDIGTILLLGAFLLLFTVLFFRFRIKVGQSIENGYFNRIFLMPAVFLITFSLFVSGSSFFQDYIQPILCAVLAFILPLFYYNVAVGSKAIEDSRELEIALLRTRADMEHYRGMIELEDRVRKERHELKNRYLHIQILLHENRLEELDRYLAEEVGTRMEALGRPVIGNTLIDYILEMKKNEAQNAGITFRLSASLEREPHISDEIFCTILLNLLDNAIEASKKEKEPEILVSLGNQGAYLILKVSNRISRNVLQVNPALTTTKKDRKLHGHGVSIVRSAVREAGGLLEIRTDNGFFEVTAALPDAGGADHSGPGKEGLHA